MSVQGKNDHLLFSAFLARATGGTSLQESHCMYICAYVCVSHLKNSHFATSRSCREMKFCMRMTQKNEEYFNTENDIKNEDNLKKEDNLKNPDRTLTELTQPQLCQFLFHFLIGYEAFNFYDIQKYIKNWRSTKTANTKDFSKISWGQAVSS